MTFVIWPLYSYINTTNIIGTYLNLYRLRSGFHPMSHMSITQTSIYLSTHSGTWLNPPIMCIDFYHLQVFAEMIVFSQSSFSSFGCCTVMYMGIHSINWMMQFHWTILLLVLLFQYCSGIGCHINSTLLLFLFVFFDLLLLLLLPISVIFVYCAFDIFLSLALFVKIIRYCTIGQYTKRTCNISPRYNIEALE